MSHLQFLAGNHGRHHLRVPPTSGALQRAAGGPPLALRPLVHVVQGPPQRHGQPQAELGAEGAGQPHGGEGAQGLQAETAGQQGTQHLGGGGAVQGRGGGGGPSVRVQQRLDLQRRLLGLLEEGRGGRQPGLLTPMGGAGDWGRHQGGGPARGGQCVQVQLQLIRLGPFLGRGVLTACAAGLLVPPCARHQLLQRRLGLRLLLLLLHQLWLLLCWCCPRHRAANASSCGGHRHGRKGPPGVGDLWDSGARTPGGDVGQEGVGHSMALQDGAQSLLLVCYVIQHVLILPYASLHGFPLLLQGTYAGVQGAKVALLLLAALLRCHTVPLFPFISAPTPMLLHRIQPDKSAIKF